MKTIRINLGLSLATLLAFGISTVPVLASTAHRVSAEQGVIQHVDFPATTLTLKNPWTGAIWGFEWNGKTRIREHNQPIIPHDLKPGETIKVRYKSYERGNIMIAKSITVVRSHTAVSPALLGLNRPIHLDTTQALAQSSQ